MQRDTDRGGAAIPAASDATRAAASDAIAARAAASDAIAARAAAATPAATSAAAARAAAATTDATRQPALALPLPAARTQRRWRRSVGHAGEAGEHVAQDLPAS